MVLLPLMVVAPLDGAVVICEMVNPVVGMSPSNTLIITAWPGVVLAVSLSALGGVIRPARTK